MRVAIPGIQIACTFSSPSVARWPGRFGADHADYVPLDAAEDASRTLEALDPVILVFSRGDLWPELVASAHRSGIPIAVLGATVRQSSKRLRWPVRSLFRRQHQAIDWLGAVTAADAARWRRLGVRAEAITVAGDPRHDQIIERVARIDVTRPLSAWARDRTVLVAGSTERRDEEVLLAAYRQLARSSTTTGLVLVPHDPTPQSISQIARLAERHGLTVAVWRGGPLEPDANCIVAATVGSLADLYLIADIAYVGGGFRQGHLHAVVEPASYALPVVFGPEYGGFADAVELVRSGGGLSLPRRSAQQAMTRVWQSLLCTASHRVEAGMHGRATLAQGAAHRTVAALLSLLGERR
jgi:3-deoxy-D-manno-octulosonic-acid transferase